jgi:hypothetical protein
MQDADRASDDAAHAGFAGAKAAVYVTGQHDEPAGAVRTG